MITPTTEEAVAALDSYAGKEDRRQRATVIATALVGDARAAVITRAGRLTVEKALFPRKTQQFPTERQRSDIERQVVCNVDQLVVDQVVSELRQADERAILNDPDRAEEQRIWVTYQRLVVHMARMQGNREDEWVQKWHNLIADRVEAEAVGESTAAMDRRLAQMGVPFPVFPKAALTATTNDDPDLLEVPAKRRRRP